MKLKTAKSFLVALQGAKTDVLTVKSIQKIFLDAVGQELVFSPSDDSHEYLEYTKRTGVDPKSGGIFMNGRFIELNEQYQGQLMETLTEMREHLQGEIHSRRMQDTANVDEYFMSMQGVSKRRNKYVFGEVRVLDVVVKKSMRDKTVVVDTLGWISPIDGDVILFSIILIDDFATVAGRKSALEALRFVHVNRTCV
jgi:hypothetical protein